MTKRNGRRVDLSSLPELRGSPEDVERAIALRLIMIKAVDEAFERLETLKEFLPEEEQKVLNDLVEPQLLRCLQEADAMTWITNYKFSGPDPDVQISLQFVLPPPPAVLH